MKFDIFKIKKKKKFLPNLKNGVWPYPPIKRQYKKRKEEHHPFTMETN